MTTDSTLSDSRITTLSEDTAEPAETASSATTARWTRPHGSDPAVSSNMLPAGLVEAGGEVRGTEARAVDTCRGGMVPEESSGPAENSSLHETPHQAAQEPGSAALAAPSTTVRRYCDQALAIRNQRLAILRNVAALIAQEHCTERAACQAVGIPQPTYTRWRDAMAEHGDDGLIPGYDRCGRRSEWEKHVPPEQREWLAGKLQYLNGKIGDASTAVRLVAEMDDCPPGLSVYLRNLRRFPRSVLRAAHISAQTRSKFKGPRNYQLNSIVNIRTMTEIINGSEVLIEPGDWWELDDMSLNQPFWFEIPSGHDEWRGCTVDGIALGRQGLYAQDIASGKWLGHMLIGRPRDAYRAEDILRYLKLLMTAWGKPRRGLRLERGIWRSKRITGYRLQSGYAEWTEEQIDRPGLDEEQSEVLVASLRQLGIEVVYCYSPHQKGFIEGGFRHLQRYMSATPYTDIGRQRGENESAAKGLVSAKGGHSHPAARGFAHIEEARAALVWAESFLNSHPKDGRLQRGIPDERWVAAQVKVGPLPKLTQDDLAVFLPERRELPIRGGHVTPEFSKQPFPFINPELFAQLGNGYRLLIAFDPSEPAAGAALWNNDTTMSNRPGWKVGQFLGWAQYDPPAPQFGVRPDDTSSQARKTYANWHRTEFSAIKDFGRGEASRESAARDGRGNSVSLVKDPAPAPTTTEATRPRANRQPTQPAPRRAADPHPSHSSPRSQPAPVDPCAGRTRDTFADIFGEL